MHNRSFYSCHILWFRALCVYSPQVSHQRTLIPGGFESGELISSAGFLGNIFTELGVFYFARYIGIFQLAHWRTAYICDFFCYATRKACSVSCNDDWSKYCTLFTFSNGLPEVFGAVVVTPESQVCSSYPFLCQTKNEIIKTNNISHSCYFFDFPSGAQNTRDQSRTPAWPTDHFSEWLCVLDVVWRGVLQCPGNITSRRHRRNWYCTVLRNAWQKVTLPLSRFAKKQQ